MGFYKNIGGKIIDKCLGDVMEREDLDTDTFRLKYPTEYKYYALNEYTVASARELFDDKKDVVVKRVTCDVENPICQGCFFNKTSGVLCRAPKFGLACSESSIFKVIL